LPGNSPEVQDSIIIKLLKLYSEHEILSVKIIGVLRLISDSIDFGNGEKVEIYSKIEKGFIAKLVKINLIIKSFEEICFVTSEELNTLRAISLSNHNTIQVMDKLIRKKLKISLSDISAQIDNFSLQPFYTHSLSSKIFPQFVDISL